MRREFFKCNTNRTLSHLVRQMLSAVFMAVRTNSELKRGVAHISALTMRAGMKSRFFCSILTPPGTRKWHANTALQFPPQRRNPRKKQVPGITK